MGLRSPWIRGVTLFLYSTLLQETLLRTCRRKAILHILQMKSLKTGMSALFALFHTQMWDRRARFKYQWFIPHKVGKQVSTPGHQHKHNFCLFAVLLHDKCLFFLPLSSFHVRFSLPVLASPSLVLTVASRLFLNSLIMFYFPSLSLLSSTIKFSKD